MATVTVLEVGGFTAPPPRSPSPKLGDFSKIFDMGFFLNSKPKLPDLPVKLPSRPTSPLLPETTYTTPRFLDGLDLSKLASPIKSNKVEPVSPSSIDAQSAQKSSSSAAAEAYSTPASSPPSSSEKTVNNDSQSAQKDTLHNEAPKIPKYTGKPVATPETDNDPEFHAYACAYTNAKADATPGWNEGVKAYYAMQIAQQERIVRAQTRVLNSIFAQEFIFSVPWSKIPQLHDSRPHGAIVPWSDGIGHHIGPKPPPMDIINPLYHLPKPTKLAVLKAELLEEYTLDRSLFTKLDGLRDPIHVFVDLSNIVIGFYDCVKAQRGFPSSQKVKAPPFLFEALALLLERGRDVAKRVLAGSVVNTWGSWPGYMLEAQQCGYEMNILQRVAKTPKRKGPRGKYDTTSGADSSDDTRGATKRPYPLKHGEQGVDEILHLKIAQSILDYNPSTMVLATGDAAEAEYSDGFKKNVERALERGWNVELIAWRKGISYSWREQSFKQKWGTKFRIIELDPVAEELLGFYTTPLVA
ncbi:hypothetical protein UCRPA7_2951 [Phaeoacremonium minimum UCRPA7]|uniref:NYN domain-containing protein n=1 Tax=Phaeoacremonium minimum (strain UCR-PA7) TaxID=1286976 RepID=R8BQD4_PHAM7|nr:hypothetical protein UCRPA7_2951 [Phaeoacremonium minimum UCRPA7]EOO01562.1 hypothetical protein UCRPA7_2951 [Phaeoacremonium minimum UCRPA7]